jgi:hypothetical protein
LGESGAASTCGRIQEAAKWVRKLIFSIKFDFILSQRKCNFFRHIKGN